MIDILKNTIEYQNFGWNLLTFSAIATIIFTIALFRVGLLNQLKTVLQEGIKTGSAGKSVSVSWNTYFVFLYAVILLYGFHIKSLAVIFNGILLALGHLAVLLSLYRYKKIILYEKYLILLFVFLPLVMIMSPLKAWVYFFSQIGGVIMVIFQPIEIWKNRDIGNIDKRFIVAYLVNVSFWLIYAFAIKDWAIGSVTAAYTVLYIITLGLCYRFKPK